MTEAELKLTLFRWIDQLSGDRLKFLFKLVSKKLGKIAQNPNQEIELGYAAMAADTNREDEALEWIEGVLNHEEL